MAAIQLMACIGMVVGTFLILNLSFEEFTKTIFGFINTAPNSIRTNINEFNHRKKQSYFRRVLRETELILKATGKSEKFSEVCAASMMLFLAGGCIALFFKNGFLVPVLAVGLMMMPFWYIKLTAGHFKKDVASELETALSVITTAYLRTENFQLAVEENVKYLNHPMKEVFEHYLSRIKKIDPDVEAALEELKHAINNDVWEEWCAAVSACQTDRSLKTTLQPIVSKLSDMRIVNGELENMVMEPRKEFITMAVLVLLNIPLIRFINKDWYMTLTDTAPGQIVIAVCIGAVFVSLAFVVKLTQPIEYRR